MKMKTIFLSKKYKKLESLATDFISVAKNGLKIRTGKLVDEYSEHSETYADVGIMYSEVVEFHEIVKLSLKTVRSKVELFVRKNPDKYIEGSVTEKSVAAAIEKDERVMKAEMLKIKALGLSKRVESVKDAYDHRRSMLNNIQDLISNGLINPMARVDDAEVDHEIKKTKDRKRDKKKGKNGRR